MKNILYIFLTYLIYKRFRIKQVNKLFLSHSPVNRFCPKHAKLLCYNVNTLPFLSKTLPSTFTNDLLAFDIIVLQECCFKLNQGPDDIAYSLAMNGFETAIGDTYNFFTKHLVCSGLVTCVRKTALGPITKRIFRPYQAKASIDSFMTKGILLVLLEQERLVIVNTHMQSDYDSSEWPANQDNSKTRRQQFKELVDFLSEEIPRSGGYSLLLAGDFNFRSDEEVAFLRTGFDNVVVHGFDAVFSTEGLTIDNARITDFVESDHKAIIADLSWQN